MKTKPSKVNEELNKLKTYVNKACMECGRKYPDTILNVEGFIHHRTKLTCVNLKSCKKAKK